MLPRARIAHAPWWRRLIAWARRIVHRDIKPANMLAAPTHEVVGLRAELELEKRKVQVLAGVIRSSHVTTMPRPGEGAPRS